MIFGGGGLIHMGMGLPFTDAMVAAYLASFFEVIINPPFPWFVQLYLYCAPVAGVYVIADTIATLTSMLFGQRHKMQKWWEMVASTYDNHAVVCGVGKVGYRVINELRKQGIPVIGVEENFETVFVQELLEEGVPIIQGNARIHAVLKRANIQRARAALCVTNDDLTNLDIAFTSREICPDLRVVIRVFDDTIAKKMEQQFDLPVISTSYAAAPAFVSEALGWELPQTQLTLFGHAARLHSAQVNQAFVGKTVAEVEENLRVKILGYRSPEGKERFPSPQLVLASGAHIIVARSERENTSSYSIELEGN